MKAGEIQNAEKYVFWGITHTDDAELKEQFYQALEWTLSFRNLNKDAISRNIFFLSELRKKSVDYLIESKKDSLSKTVTLAMISDFSDNYTKAVKGFAQAEYVNFVSQNNMTLEFEEIEEQSVQFAQSINPLLTNASFGGFKFSVATNFVDSFGKSKDLKKLSNSVIHEFHNTIFKQDFTNQNISLYKKKFSDKQREMIFRPVFNIRSSKKDYNVSYFDRGTANSYKINKTKPNQKLELIPIKEINYENIGELENILMHTRETNHGSSRSTILRQKMNSYNFTLSTNSIEIDNKDPIPLNFSIKINVDFNSASGFSFSYDILPVRVISKTYPEGLNNFFVLFIDFIKDIVSKKELTSVESQYLKHIFDLIGNPYILN